MARTKRRRAVSKRRISRRHAAQNPRVSAEARRRAGASSRSAQSETRPSDRVITMVPVRGIGNTSQAFRDKVLQIAARLETNPNFLLAVMSFESGGTFSPSVKNQAGSGAVGLIQFMPATAVGLGTTTEAWQE